MPDVFRNQQESEPESSKSSTIIDNKKGDKKNDAKKSYLTENLLKLGTGSEVHSLPDHTHNVFSGFNMFPDKVNFSSSDPDEKIVLLLRRHPITNLPWLVVAFFLIVAPSFFPVLSFFTALPNGFQVIITLIWYLITTSYVLENFLEWFFNINLITTERVIDVDFVNLLYREVTEAELEKIQEPTFDMGGVAESFFNYGDVYIQTAAEVSRIEFTSVPKPDKVVKVLRDLGIKEEVERMKRRYT